MRRVHIEEQSATSTNLTVPGAEQELPVEQAAPLATATAKQKTARSGRALRWAIVVFGSLGIFSLLVQPLTGASLGEWLQGANFKAAYSSSNLTFMRGMAALKVNNLRAATNVLLTLPPESKEAGDLAMEIYPRVMKAKDYETAIKISNFFNGVASRIEANPTGVGTAMGNTLGLNRSMKLLQQARIDPAQRQAILTSMFDAVTARELSALEKLVPTLPEKERVPALISVANAYAKLGMKEEAWKRTRELPELERNRLRASMIGTGIGKDLPMALSKVDELTPGLEANQARSNIIQALSYKDLKGAQKVALKMTPGKLKDDIMVHLAQAAAMQMNPNQAFAFIEQLKPAERPGALVELALQGGMHTGIALKVFPKLATLARTNPGIAKTHDQLSRYLAIAARDTKLRDSYVNLTRDPKARAALKQELKAGVPVTATLEWGNKVAKLQRNGSSISSSVSSRESRGQSTAPSSVK